MERKENFIKSWIAQNYVEGADDEYGNIHYVTAEAEREYHFSFGYEEYVCEPKNFVITQNYVTGADDEYGNIFSAGAKRKYLFGKNEENDCEPTSEDEFETMEVYYPDTQETLKESIWTKSERNLKRILIELNKSNMWYRLDLCKVNDDVFIDVDISRSKHFIIMLELNSILKSLKGKCEISSCEVTYEKDHINKTKKIDVLYEKEYKTENLTTDYIKSRSLLWHYKRFTRVKLYLT
jgi:hypothetical protein